MSSSIVCNERQILHLYDSTDLSASRNISCQRLEETSFKVIASVSVGFIISLSSIIDYIFSCCWRMTDWKIAWQIFTRITISVWVVPLHLCLIFLSTSLAFLSLEIYSRATISPLSFILSGIRKTFNPLKSSSIHSLVNIRWLQYFRLLVRPNLWLQTMLVTIDLRSYSSESRQSINFIVTYFQYQHGQWW